MNTATNRNRLLIELSSFKIKSDFSNNRNQAGLYQEIASSVIRTMHRRGALTSLYNQLVEMAQQAHAYRQMAKVEQISEMLMSPSLPAQYQSVGRYYKALCISDFGRGDDNRARRLHESLVSAAPPSYKARAIQSLAVISCTEGDLKSALSLYVEAGRAASCDNWCDPQTTVTAHKMIGVLKSYDGDHEGAVAHLKQMLPLAGFVGRVHPLVYFDYLNSLAVELGHLGQKGEAQALIRPVLASPFAHAYPEWQETALELSDRERDDSHPFVSFSQARFLTDPAGDEGVPEPVAADSSAPDIPEPHQPGTRHGAAGVLLFPKPLQSLAKPPRPKAVTPEDLAQMTTSQKRGLVLALVHDHETSDDEYERILGAAGLVKDGPVAREIDLESESALEEMMIQWCGAIGSTEVAAVLSALRDCDDDFRRTTILDKMISYAFRESPQCSQSESEWRSRVEAKLKKPSVQSRPVELQS